MLEIFTEKEIEVELSTCLKPTSYSKKDSYPYNDLTDRQFEFLLYEIFKSDINNSVYSGIFDTVNIMKGVGERGRDNTLHLDGKNVGLIQCKKYQNLVTKPELAREVIKFIIHSIIDKSLVHDINDFTYYFVVSKGFNEKALELLNDFNKIISETKLTNWIKEVLEENETFKVVKYDEISEEVKSFLSLINVKKIIPTDLDSKLSLYPQIKTMFFEVEKVIDIKSFELLFSEMMTCYNINALNDDDLRELSKKLTAIPLEKRFNTGLFSIYGYNNEFVKQIILNKSIMAHLVALKSEIENLVIQEIPKITREIKIREENELKMFHNFVKESIDPFIYNKVLYRFISEVNSKVIADMMFTNNNDEKLFEEIKYTLISQGCDFLNKNFTRWESTSEDLEKRKFLASIIYQGISSKEDMNKIWDEQIPNLKPIINKIKIEVENRVLPKTPTIIIEGMRFFDDRTGIENMLKSLEGLEKI